MEITGTLKWRRVGREYHSTDGRFEIYCSGVVRRYYGSIASWVLIDTQTGRRTQLRTREACQAKAAEWKEQ